MSPIAELHGSKLFYFSVLKSIFGIAATRLKSRWSSAVTGMPLGQRIASAITDPGGGKWTLNVTLMVLGREKMLQYYRQLSTDTPHGVELAGRACFIYVDCCSLFRGQFRPTRCLRVSSVPDETSVADNTKSKLTTN